jgi:hypothetical protein
VLFWQSKYALGLRFRSFRVLQKLECNRVFVLCILQQVIDFFDCTMCTHMDFGLFYFLWVHLFTTWNLAFPSFLFIWMPRHTLCGFAYFFDGKLRIVVVWCVWMWHWHCAHAHCTQFIVFFECIVHGAQTHMDFDCFAFFECIVHGAQTHMDFNYFACFECIWMCALSATL